MSVSVPTRHIPDASADEKWWKETALIVALVVAMPVLLLAVLMLLGFDEPSLLP